MNNVFKTPDGLSSAIHCGHSLSINALNVISLVVKHRENMQSQNRKDPGWELNPESSCCEVKVKLHTLFFFFFYPKSHLPNQLQVFDAFQILHIWHWTFHFFCMADPPGLTCEDPRQNRFTASLWFDRGVNSSSTAEEFGCIVGVYICLILLMCVQSTDTLLCLPYST